VADVSRLKVALTQKRYAGAGADVLTGLQFELETGDFVAIVGPSGAGKTTLLKIIAGLDARYEGQVELTPGCRIGFVFQEPRLLPWLTVADNLRLVKPDLDETALREALHRVGLAANADSFPLRLSGGMQRRVSLLRAFLIKPELLLLDEPFISLDAPTAESLYQLLLELRRDVHPTTLLVTHELREALALADRILFVSRSPARVILDYRVTLPRPRRRDDALVMQAHADLLNQHPELLAGLRTAPADSSSMPELAP
jgi:ABC-type nitrate/sulfonate/bicarbonate transport system ATPase subunit